MDSLFDITLLLFQFLKSMKESIDETKHISKRIEIKVRSMCGSGGVAPSIDGTVAIAKSVT
jgi:hypothetical protein